MHNSKTTLINDTYPLRKKTSMDNSAQQYYVLMFMRNQAGGKMSSSCFLITSIFIWLFASFK